MNGKKIVKLLMYLITVVFSGKVEAQMAAPGFVQEDVVKQAGATTDALVYGLSSAYRTTTRAYVDGLGRTIQTVGVQASPLQNDVIAPAAFDNLGRQLKAYLPYAGQSTDVMGSYRTNAISTAQPAFYQQTSQYLIPTDTAAYMRKVVENSPMQRMLEAGSAGTGFQPNSGQHFQTVSHRPNSYAADGNIAMTGTTGAFTTFYTDGALWVTDGKDADNEETLVFKNIAGQVVLKRQVTGQSETYYDTYYVYNNAGGIKYIVPPKAAHSIIANGNTISTPSVANLIYSYTYNNQGQVISRTAPGSGTVSVIYDPLNRPVLTQDVNRALAHQWYYIKYDAKDRPVETGIYTDNSHTTAPAMQTYVSGLSGYNTTWYESRTTSSSYYYYTNSVFPTSSITPLTYNYYDNYNWNDNGTTFYTYSAQAFPATGPEGQSIATPSATTDSLKGLPTITMSRTIGPGLSNIWLMNVMFYDNYGRVIQTQTNNQLKYTAAILTDSKTVSTDFTGKPVATKSVTVTGTGTANTNTILTTFNYDAGNSRLADVDQTYNSQANVHIAHYTYNEISQLISKNLAYNNTLAKYLQTVDYRYNIRGELLSINNSKLSNDGGITNSDTTDVFGMQLMYDKTDANLGTVTPSYTGRLSAVKWMTRNGGDTRVNERSYVFSYDQLGRDTSSVYAERTVSGTGTFNQNNHGFDENGITYDDGGNISALKRTSSSGVGATSHTLVDNLTYTYDSTLPNQLDAVADATGNNLGFTMTASASGSYSYDSEGNLTVDPYKGLSLKYNVINRVDSITRTASGTNNAYISYTYDASGNVIRKQVWSTGTTLQTTTDYIGGMVYTTQSGSTTLTYTSMPEGRVVNSGTALVPEYVFSDQQGNARFSFQDNGSGGIKVIQESSFYAFGEVLANSPVATPTVPNINLYNGGSEWQNEFNNLPDYHQTFFRNYDPAIGRFIASDPKPESADGMTTYQFAGNNPVMKNDPGGDKATSYPQQSMPLNNWYFAYGASGAVQAHFDAEMGITDDVWSGFGGGGWGGGIGGGSGGYGGGSGGDYSGYWSAETDYLNNPSTENEDVTLSGKQISNDYTSYLNTGSNSAFSADIASSDADDPLNTLNGAPLAQVNVTDQGVDYGSDWGKQINYGNANQGGHNGTATVYVETDGLGHAYIEVNNTVFSFGRYAGGDSPALGRFDPVGPGILIKGTHQFATDRMQKFPTNVYQFSNVDANAIYNYLNDIYNCGIPNPGKNGGVYTGLTYTLLGPNCTTIVSGALQVGGANIPMIGSPADFVRFENGDLYPPGMQAH